MVTTLTTDCVTCLDNAPYNVRRWRADKTIDFCEFGNGANKLSVHLGQAIMKWYLIVVEP